MHKICKIQKLKCFILCNFHWLNFKFAVSEVFSSQTWSFQLLKKTTPKNRSPEQALEFTSLIWFFYSLLYFMPIKMSQKAFLKKSAHCGPKWPTPRSRNIICCVWSKKITLPYVRHFHNSRQNYRAGELPGWRLHCGRRLSQSPAESFAVTEYPLRP